MDGWKKGRKERWLCCCLVVGVSLADFRRGSTQSFLHRYTSPTTSSVPDFHTEEYRYV